MWPECGATPCRPRQSGLLRGDCRIPLRQGDWSANRRSPPWNAAAILAPLPPNPHPGTVTGRIGERRLRTRRCGDFSAAEVLTSQRRGAYIRPLRCADASA